MKFREFHITNFKGIKHAELKLSQYGQGKIFTLVGLNESGKTTILEAINSFSPDLSAESLFRNDVFRKVEHRDLVPKDRKDNFTGEVEIKALLEFSEKDLLAVRKYVANTHDLDIDLEALGSSIIVKRVFVFEKSDYKSEKSIWTINIKVKTRDTEEYELLNYKDDVWQHTVEFIRNQIPAICYFPTFLFDFPTLVYLSHTPEQYEPQNRYYLQIIQDVLDSMERGLTIEEHIVSRVENIEEGEKWDFFKFFRSDRKEQVDAVMNRLGNQITTSVFTRWNEIFGSQFTKRIKIEWGVDENKAKPPVYLSFSVQDGTSTYGISERSLGFRWFFCFLLFTQFRKSRPDSGTLFLFDEPASNLHATAQQQLLSSFDSVADGNNCLIYSTHSHYMINPNWLEGAFIVQNGAIEYDEELFDADHYQFHETDVKVTPYKRFVGENPDKATYYQPILDALDYKPSVLEHQSKTIMVEGKDDFYAFTYFKEIVFELDKELRFLPSSGANDLGPLIALYLGWNYGFNVLLDDDNAGRAAKKRYCEEFYLGSPTVSTIGDLDGSLRRKKLEGLISREGKNLVKAHLKAKKLTKKMLARFFQDKLARREKFKFDETTASNFKIALQAICELVVKKES